MSQKLPILSGQQLVEFFRKKFGFGVYEGKGDHVKMKGYVDGQLRIFPVSLHRELAKGTTLGIIKESGLTRDRFLKLWRE